MRLRVNEASKGAQVPWNAREGRRPTFMFFDRAPDAPAQAAPDQVASVMRNKPIRDLGAQDAYAAALDRDTLQGYEEFLTRLSRRSPGAGACGRSSAARREAITWLRTYRADTPQAYWSYLRRYPRRAARRRCAAAAGDPDRAARAAAVLRGHGLRCPAAAAGGDSSMSIVRCWCSAIPYYDFAAAAAAAGLFPAAAAAGFRRAGAAACGRSDLFILPQPVFVPIPVYVRAPRLCRAAANNIIFANIHNTTVINTVINRPPPPPQGFAPGQRAPAGADVKGIPAAVPAPGGASPRAAAVSRTTRHADPARQGAGAADASMDAANSPIKPGVNPAPPCGVPTRHHQLSPPTRQLWRRKVKPCRGQCVAGAENQGAPPRSRVLRPESQRRQSQCETCDAAFGPAAGSRGPPPPHQPACRRAPVLPNCRAAMYLPSRARQSHQALRAGLHRGWDRRPRLLPRFRPIRLVPGRHPNRT